MPLGDVLVSSGAVTHDALEEAVRSHVEETVLGLFLWPEGRFTYRDEAPPERGRAVHAARVRAGRADRDARGILMEGMRRLDEWTRIVKVLPSDEVQLHALGPGAGSAASSRRSPRTPSRRRWASCWPSRATSRFAVCEQLFRAFERGLRRRRGAERGGDGAGAADRARLDDGGAPGAARRETMVDEGQHDEAAALLRSALALDPFRADARALMKRVARAQLRGALRASCRAIACRCSR